MSQTTLQIDKICADGARRLLSRAAESYSLPVEVMTKRVLAAVNKYVLNDEPSASPKVTAEFIDALQADDLCLIVACEQGEQRAWNDLVERFSTTVRSAARSASGNEDAAEDLAQSIWAELHGLRVRDDGRPAGKLAYYSGRGSLAGWLRAVVAQLAVDQHRKVSRLVQTEEDADFDRLIQDGADDGARGLMSQADPEFEVSRKLASGQMQSALAKSLETLTAEDRLLVKLYYFDGLRLREAGAVLGVHEATASRRLTRIHEELRKHTEKILIEDKGWTPGETRAAFSELAVHMDTNIEPMLAGETVSLKKENEING